MPGMLVSVILTVLLATSAAAQTRPDTAALAAAGQRSLQRMSGSGASWVVDTTLENGTVVSVDVLQADGTGGHRRLIFRLANGNQQFELLRIIMRDGLWYCADANRRRKFRPYELPAETALVYLCLGRVEPLFITDQTYFDQEMKIEGVTDGTLTVRQPLDEASREALQGALAGFERLKQLKPAAITPDMERNFTMMRDMLANGQPQLIDVESGQLLEYGSVKMRTRVRDLKFLEHVDPRGFDVAGIKWDDHSDDPTAGDVNDLVMISYNPLAKPGQDKGDMDGQLMDVKSGRFRRIPFQGTAVMGGCFLPGRKSVVVSGMPWNAASLRPFVVDLVTGANRAIGGEEFDKGFAIGGNLSPDGKTLVIARLIPGATLTSQIYLIDIATGQAKPLGKPMDTAFLNWTADGQRIVLVHRESAGMDKPSRNSLAIMDLDGKVKVLRRGNAPVLLADRETIFFQDDDTRLWHTCDLNGENVKLFADGLPGNHFPAVAPDGERILMMKMKKGSMPVPVELRIGQAEGRPITTEPGLWGMPAWR